MAQIFRGHACSGNVDPCIKSAFRRLATKTGNAIQIARELFTAASELGDHTRGVALAITERVDRGVLSEFGNAGVGIHSQHGERGNYFRWSNGVTEKIGRASCRE